MSVSFPRTCAASGKRRDTFFFLSFLAESSDVLDFVMPSSGSSSNGIQLRSASGFRFRPSLAHQDQKKTKGIEMGREERREGCSLERAPYFVVCRSGISTNTPASTFRYRNRGRSGLGLLLLRSHSRYMDSWRENRRKLTVARHMNESFPNAF
ncbi:hypothetical protein GW17_00014150 [Ensete ventricosum]|nr:hypothetical protein GW17_00014150 [Ensete ventricosum]